MKDKFVNSSIAFIQKYEECDELKLIKLRYGLQGIYGLFVKLTVCIILSAILGTIKETCLFLLFYTGIRTFSYGWHAKNSKSCWVMTIIIYNIIPLLTKHLVIPNIGGYIILGFSILSMLLWAPADTPKKPLIRKKQRIKCKIIATSVVLIYSIIFYISKNSLINNALLYSLIIQSLFVNPLMYKLTKTQFNNYRYYKKKHE